MTRLIHGPLVLVLLLLATSPTFAQESLHDSARARRLLAIGRGYLPGDWRYPTTEAWLDKDKRVELSTLLPVTPREQRTGYSCGAASLGIMLSHHGLHMGDRKLEKVTGTTREGVDPWQIVNGARRLGFEVQEKYDATPEDVSAALALGRPVLIDFQASYGPDDEPGDDWGHYSIVVAADERDFLVVDPSVVNPQHLRRIPKKSLPKVWWDTFITNGKRFQGWMMTMTRTSEPDLLAPPIVPLDAE
jgi:hypothetical protein